MSIFKKIDDLFRMNPIYTEDYRNKLEKGIKQATLIKEVPAHNYDDHSDETCPDKFVQRFHCKYFRLELVLYTLDDYFFLRLFAYSVGTRGKREMVQDIMHKEKDGLKAYTQFIRTCYAIQDELGEIKSVTYSFGKYENSIAYDIHKDINTHEDSD